jgi:molybdate transport system ATP-binding protein
MGTPTLKVDIQRALPGFKLDVHFTLNHDIMAVLGPSGAGKTMTLQCIAGLIQPDKGHIELNGQTLFDSARAVNLPPQRRRVGFVFQNYALFPHLTVLQNVSYGIEHLPKAEVRAKAGQLMETMHVSQLSHRYPRQLSAGQQQRVAIARALATDPDVLLLDEPFSALDTQLKERLELELLALQQSYRGSMLLVTHDLSEGYKLGTAAAIFQGGRIVQCGSREEVFGRPADRNVARLTGVRNLMEGTVSRTEGGYVYVLVTAWGSELKVRNGFGLTLAPGQRVVVGIRPEYIRLTGETGQNVFPSVIMQLAEGIASIAYRFRVESDTQAKHYINATISKSAALCLHKDEVCLLFLPPEDLILIIEDGAVLKSASQG